MFRNKVPNLVVKEDPDTDRMAQINDLDSVVKMVDLDLVVKMFLKQDLNLEVKIFLNKDPDLVQAILNKVLDTLRILNKASDMGKEGLQSQKTTLAKGIMEVRTYRAVRGLTTERPEVTGARTMAENETGEVRRNAGRRMETGEGAGPMEMA